ncbi:hypothetical protein UCMB321_4332 [Pseudomonas batumici]|uniref:Uncharacterized protein n=1 Tax=Pseudomonas batumici TaxID=226910 RepID=A0A0C2IAB7_9PSED|nr:hypothetical protein UCMB321_4306 [Pseudomonas batumici]KIH82027.1 hypothetical protein UCMB321_4332 [Pseudomonas batumici]
MQCGQRTKTNSHECAPFNVMSALPSQRAVLQMEKRRDGSTGRGADITRFRPARV